MVFIRQKLGQVDPWTWEDQFRPTEGSFLLEKPTRLCESLDRFGDLRWFSFARNLAK